MRRLPGSWPAGSGPRASIPASRRWPVRAADVPAGTLGYRVRIGSFRTKAAADEEKARLTAAGKAGNSVYTGWDGDRRARGPWHVDVVTVDPKRFDGRLGASYGADLHDRDTTSALAQAAGAKVAVNAGFFVLDPAAGAPGDPAGVGVYRGRVLSEPTNGRPSLVLHDDGRSGVERLTWRGRAEVGGRQVRLDGINRVPGLIRNCGGDASDRPTAQPLHDVTCTDDSELVAFTRDYGRETPSGPGREVVVDAHHVVRSVAGARGAALPAGSTSLQATGASTAELADVRVGDRLPVRSGLAGASGAPRPVAGDTTIVNGGPQLVRDGKDEITQQRDGMVHADDPSFSYGWAAQRNPRTFAGTDRRGRTVLVTVDGRSTDDLGLSIPEAADVARSLGLVDAVNLDGGGSTTMAVDGRVVGRPSDPAGERPVGDGVMVLPPAPGD
nr:phosphodiester glycosidase family protein [Streptomyces meridianus]